jgi:CRISPR/Cas system CSM-associated protein Csm3 (group 7 of RAMP superfamily)
MERLFYRRFRIEGTLTSLTPLHIGTGLTKKRPIGDENVNVSEVVRDVNGCPVIPGSTLKGVLRARRNNFPDREEIIDSLFGTEESGNEKGGRLLFQDSQISQYRKTPPLFQNKLENGEYPLYWKSEDAFTYITTGTAVNRVTRTVEKHKLYHNHTVPAGTSFHVCILGEGLTDEELAFLLTLLNEFKKDQGIAMGGKTAQSMGRMIWKLEQVKGISDETALKKWLYNGNAAGFEGLDPLSPETLGAIRDKFVFTSAIPANYLNFEIELAFDGPFLVSDPSQACPSRESDEGGLSHAYLKDEKGKMILRASSFRGALRSQAERIIRTFEPKKACYVESRDNSCQPVTQKEQVANLCMACKVFGSNGWRSPIVISDFHPVAEGEEYQQEFVAIDRFTGGAADKKKFKAKYRFKPVLKGTLRIDVSRITAGQAGLLALTLRDLLEGDIRFGFGSSKGFGECRGAIKHIMLPAQYPEWLKGIADDLSEVVHPMKKSQVELLKNLVDEFGKEV